MRGKNRKRLTNLLIWLTAEVLLNLVGLDNWADYAEFVFDHQWSGGTLVQMQIGIH
jgi:hypothetical protein